MVVSIEPDVVTVSKIAIEPSTPLPKNSVDVVGPLAPPKDLVVVDRQLAPPP